MHPLAQDPGANGCIFTSVSLEIILSPANLIPGCQSVVPSVCVHELCMSKERLAQRSWANGCKSSACANSVYQALFSYSGVGIQKDPGEEAKSSTLLILEERTKLV